MVGPNDRVITADVEDFFVVDEHQYLAKMAVSILNAMDRHLVERNSLFLLRSQLKHNDRGLKDFSKLNRDLASYLSQVVKSVIPCL